MVVNFRLSNVLLRVLHRALILTALSCLSLAALADVSSTPDPLFQDDEALNVTITAPLTTLIKERSKDEYLPGAFQYTELDGDTVDFDLDIRARGHSRHAICEFPPVTLNLKRKQAKGTLFDNQNKLKLVIQCNKRDRYEQMVLREYLAYRIMNILTDASYRVRLLRVTYVNTETDGENKTRYAFLIEHKNRLAARLDKEIFEIERASIANMQPDHLNLTSVFQFLIGNTDFSPIAGPPEADCCHNYVLFANADDPILALPYDYDQSGFVNAPYALPNENFRIRSVRQRVYRGRCVNNEYVEASLTRFREHRDEIYKTIVEQEGLESGVRDQLVRYVDGFYKLIDKPRDVERKIINKCAG
jgi:hypothetical protein